MPHYMFTLTRSEGGFSAHEVFLFTEYFDERYVVVLLVEESHKTGGIHLHGVCEDPVKEVTSLTKRIVRLYHSFKIPVVTGVSVHIKKVTGLDGALSYCMKHQLRETQSPCLLKGWCIKDLRRKAIEAVRLFDSKDAKRPYRYVNQREINGLVIQYAKTSGMPLMNKASFIDVMTAMAADKYQFASIKMEQVYAEIMAELGDQSVYRDRLELMLCNMR